MGRERDSPEWGASRLGDGTQGCRGTRLDSVCRTPKCEDSDCPRTTPVHDRGEGGGRGTESHMTPLLPLPHQTRDGLSCNPRCLDGVTGTSYGTSSTCSSTLAVVHLELHCRIVFHRAGHMSHVCVRVFVSRVVTGSHCKAPPPSTMTPLPVCVCVSRRSTL